MNRLKRRILVLIIAVYFEMANSEGLDYNNRFLRTRFTSIYFMNAVSVKNALQNLLVKVEKKRATPKLVITDAWQPCEIMTKCRVRS